MTSKAFVDKAIDIANNYKTSYIWGGLGRPITEANLQSAIKQYSVNGSYAERARRFLGQAKAFYFDCVGLLKCILWGWCGDASKSRGGAVYGAHGVPDTSADGMIAKCERVSTNFSDILPGEALWCKGHIGIYIGDGLAVECTPAWRNGVQITAVSNIGSKSGYNGRKWTKHGRLPWVDYGSAAAAVKPVVSTTPATKTPEQLAAEVIAGEWGVGAERKRRLIQAGYDYATVQKAVNAQLSGKKSVEEVAKEVLRGKWGNGIERKNKLEAAGYDYAEVQRMVGRLMR